MDLSNMFITDDEGKRVCGTCGKSKVVSEFYKDGVDRKGLVKYRRDCKDCYKMTRITEAKLKLKKERK